jgi:hypothetical protein
VDVLRLYDPDRRPPNWTEIVRATQVVAFATDIASGAPTDANGRPFANAGDMTCLVFDSLGEARRFCEERVQEIASLRFDVFDAEGRVNPALLVIVSPLRADTLESSPRAMRRRTRIACALVVLAVPLIAYDYWTADGGLILPTYLGISMILASVRLFLANHGIKDAERERQQRIARRD